MVSAAVVSKLAWMPAIRSENARTTSLNDMANMSTIFMATGADIG